MGNDWRCDYGNKTDKTVATITISDPWLGERTFEASDDAALIKDQLALLMKLRVQKVARCECLDNIDYDIALYRFILSRDNPNEAAGQYLEARHKKGGLLSKIEAVCILGWQDGVKSMIEN
jgi:hypothetical protein